MITNFLLNADLLTRIYPPIIELALLFILIMLIANARSIYIRFKSIKPAWWVVILSIFLIGLIIRVWYIPHTHLVYYDEFDNINFAQNILYSNRFCLCAQGTNTKCEVCEGYFTWPPGYHTILSLAFRFFGDYESVAFNMNAVIGSISIILIFLLVFIISEDSLIASSIAFIFSFIPSHLKYSGTSSLETVSICSILFTLLILEIYLRNNRYKSFLLFLGALFFTTQVRPENFLLIIFCAYRLLTYKKNNIISVKHLLPVIIFLVMLFPLFNLLVLGFEKSVSADWSYSLTERINYLKENSVGYILYFMDSSYSFLFIPMLVILGMINLWKRDKKRLVNYLLFITLFFITYASFSKGRIFYFENPVRYLTVIYLPLLLLAAEGIYFVISYFKIDKRLLFVVIIILTAICAIPTKPYIMSKDYFDNNYMLILLMGERIPYDAMVISYNTGIVIGTIHRETITPFRFIEEIDNKISDKPIYIFADFWWNKNRNRSEEFKNVFIKYYNITVVERYGDYAIYQLTLK